jgi:hypothetical protein
MADIKGSDRKDWFDGVDSKSDRTVRHKGSLRECADEGLEKACSYLIGKGHIEAWDYGWSFFEASLKYTREVEKQEYELEMKLHGFKPKT